MQIRSWRNGGPSLERCKQGEQLFARSPLEERLAIGSLVPIQNQDWTAPKDGWLYVVVLLDLDLRVPCFTETKLEMEHLADLSFGGVIDGHGDEMAVTVGQPLPGGWIARFFSHAWEKARA